MLTKLDPRDLDGNVFRRFGDQWPLVTAGDRSSCNTMTAGWGCLGVLWGAPVAAAFVRPQRYTREFMDRCGGFSLSFLREEYRDALKLCGAKSGRELDKISACGLTVEYGSGDIPYIAQAELVLVCRTQYVDELKPENFLDKEADAKWYPGKDWHIMYVGKILEVLQEG